MEVSPEGTAEGSPRRFSRPFGTRWFRPDQPNVETSLKRWAIVACPSGTGGL